MQTKYQRIMEIIKTKIQNEEWQPGDKIWSEREIADRYGVSRITVKKAIGELTSQKYLEQRPGRRGTFIREVELKSHISNLIGVVIDDVTDSFGAQLLRGIEDYLWKHKFHTVVCNVDRNYDKVSQYISSLIETQIAGVIFAPVIDHEYEQNNRKIINLLENERLPYVLIDRFIPEVPSSYVISDYRESIGSITKYLLSKGHERILLLVGLECTTMTEGLMGYFDAHHEAGIPCNEDLIISSNDNLLRDSIHSNEMIDLKKAIEKVGSFSALIALNDRLLKAGLLILLDLGIEVGKDVELAAHDDVTNTYPPYTSNIPMVLEPTYEMGWESAKILIDSIRKPGRAIVRIMLKSKVITDN